MILLHQIGPRINSNFNTPEEIRACTEPLSFDGIYSSVLENQDVLAGKDVTFFVMGDYVGKDNSFDVGQPYSQYLTWKEIAYLAKKYNARIGWHSWSHRDLTKLSDDEVKRELENPYDTPYFAYPYGAVDERIARLVEKAGYKEAWGVYQGDGSQFQRNRKYLNW